jgi:hypothetical protein
MKRLAAGLLSLVVLLALGYVMTTPATGEAVLYKDLACGCCNGYIAYLREAEIDVDAVNTDDIVSLKEKHKVPEDMYSCHTMIIGGYVVEGHVALAALNRLLSQQPDIAGIALPGMPSGSPGMPGPKSESFVIYVISDRVPPATFMVL